MMEGSDLLHNAEFWQSDNDDGARIYSGKANWPDLAKKIIRDVEEGATAYKTLKLTAARQVGFARRQRLAGGRRQLSFVVRWQRGTSYGLRTGPLQDRRARRRLDECVAQD
jgi:hypothetical protein